MFMRLIKCEDLLFTFDSLARVIYELCPFRLLERFGPAIVPLKFFGCAMCMERQLYEAVGDVAYHHFLQLKKLLC